MVGEDWLVLRSEYPDLGDCAEECPCLQDRDTGVLRNGRHFLRQPGKVSSCIMLAVFLYARGCFKIKQSY